MYAWPDEIVIDYVKSENATPILLAGRIVQSDGSARHRYVLVRNGRIDWVGVSRPPAALARGAREIVTGPRSWVFPGLINLHTHAAYNVLPLWHSRKAPFDNRFEWRADPDYKREVAGRLAELKTRQGAEQTLAIVSELQAIAGGTTVLDQSNRLDANAPVEEQIVLCRDTGDPTDIGLPAARRIDSIVDFFAPDADGRPAPKKDFKTGRPVIEIYAEDRDAGRLGATLVHLAEGRTGFGSGRGVDPYSRAEFEAFMQHPAMSDAAKVRVVPLALVHGCGIDTTNAAHLDFLAERGIAIVWSPVSNLLLYGDTLDVEPLMRAGLTVALGSDWSPSGSKHVWEEAKFARRFLEAIGSAVSDADIFSMVTVNPARALGNRALARIEEGACADLFIVESPIDSDSALEVFFATTDDDVMATMVNGLPIYGQRAFLEQFGLPLQNLPQREGRAAGDKAVHLPASVAIDVATAIDAVEDHLKSLTPPVQRSNLLASSDKPYQRRMQRLRGQAEFFGWSVKQTRRQGAKGQLPVNGCVAVAPDAVRVWCGFRQDGVARGSGAPAGAAAGRTVPVGTLPGPVSSDTVAAAAAAATAAAARRFLDHIGSVFVPSTVMLLRELGLTAYFPGILPVDHPPACPDKVAIMFYESRETCTDAARSVGGRLHDLLHGSVFRDDAGGSWHAFPEPLPGTRDGMVRSRAAYHLLDGAIDWYGGLTRICVGLRNPAHSVDGFHLQLHASCNAMRDTALAGASGTARGATGASARSIDGALIAVDDDYFVFWDHRTEARQGDDQHLHLFAGFSQIVMNTAAADANANGALFESWDGFPLQGGECLRVRFERRSLFPW